MTEAEIQKAVVAWARALAVKYPCLKYLHAIPNGGPRGRAVRLGAGVVRGMPDLMLPVIQRYNIGATINMGRDLFACGGCGLYIELKTPRGVVSQAQAECHEYLRSAGYRVEVCRSVEDAQAAVIEYLEG